MRLLLSLMFSLTIVSCKSSEIVKSEEILISNVNVIPMNRETILEKHSVLIKNGKIIKIGLDVNCSNEAVIINGTGKFLIPGLTDMHAHLFYPNDIDLFIANGVTLIRNMHGEESHLRIREEINSGIMLGPEIWTGTPLIDGAKPMWGISLNITDPAEVEGIITDLHDKGYDFVKTYNSLSKDVYTEIHRVAKELDIKVAGHISYIFNKTDAIKMGHYTDEHLTAYSLAWNSLDYAKPIAELAIEKGMWNVPTMITVKNNFKYEYFKEHGYEYSKYSPVNLPNNDWFMPYWNYDKSVEIINYIHKKGGKIAAGSDNGAGCVIPGISIHEEMEIFAKECGLSNYEALKTATINGAELMEVEDRVGTVEVGKDADLVLLNENPLEDIKNTMSINKVFVKGKLLDRDDLDEILNDVVESYR